MTMVDNPTWTLSERLKRSRLLAGLDQKDIAERLGVNRSTVSFWESGHTEPSASNFVRWAAVTGQPLEWLAEGVQKAPVAGESVEGLPYTPRDLNPEPTD